MKIILIHAIVVLQPGPADQALELFHRHACHIFARIVVVVGVAPVTVTVAVAVPGVAEIAR